MHEGINEEPPKWDPKKNLEGNEPFAEMRHVLSAAELMFAAHGREAAKPYLITIVRYIGGDNPWQVGEWRDKFTPEEYAELDRRYKLLSNAVGILTADGTIRHDLNPEYPYDPENPLP